MVPCVYNACAHMLSLGGDFVAVRRLSNVDGKILVGPSRGSQT